MEISKLGMNTTCTPKPTSNCEMEFNQETDVFEIKGEENEEFEALEERLHSLNICNNGEQRFGKDGINSILDLATEDANNIAIINEKLDELENGKDIWTYDITSAIAGEAIEKSFSKDKETTIPPTVQTPKPLSQKETISTNITPFNAYKKEQLEQIFASSFEEVHLENSTNPNVIAMEQEMQEMGITVTFADDLATGKIILETCKELYARGIELPKEIILMTPINDSVNGFTPIMRPGFEKEAQIFIQMGLGNKTEFSHPMFAAIGLNHFTVNSASGTFIHELGHWHHLQNNPSDEEAIQIWSSLVTPENEMTIAEKVSVHAVTDPTGKEFVAEVFAGLQTGQTYDEEVMNIYRLLNGPILN